MHDIKKLTLDELSEIVEQLGEKKFRAKQIHEWIWKKNAGSYADMKNIPQRLKDQLSKKYEFNAIKIHSAQESRDGTVKYAFQLADKLLVEGVIIPSRSRVTACISTQVGCALNCSFCATGKMGFVKNLTAAEIYEQVALLNQESFTRFERKLGNIVVMGMGEPLNNYDNTLDALQKVTSKDGLAMSPSRITLSTSGIASKIKKLADDNVKFNLAVSLHSAVSSVRTSIMPINKSNSLEKLVPAIKYFHEKTGSRITFEYLMLAGINDSLKDAQELAKYCKNFPVKINLIEYNANEYSKFQQSDKENVMRFMEFLKSRNMIVNLRKSKGDDIDAACGQLANKKSK